MFVWRYSWLKKWISKRRKFRKCCSCQRQQSFKFKWFKKQQEFVNHKILDCIGDLYTSGYRMVASVTCSQGGHFLTNKLLRKVFENKDNFSILEIKEKNLPHTLINKSLLRSIA